MPVLLRLYYIPFFKLRKVFELTAKTAEKAQYHHGDSSLYSHTHQQLSLFFGNAFSGISIPIILLISEFEISLLIFFLFKINKKTPAPTPEIETATKTITDTSTGTSTLTTKLKDLATNLAWGLVFVGAFIAIVV